MTAEVFHVPMAWLKAVQSYVFVSGVQSGRGLEGRAREMKEREKEKQREVREREREREREKERKIDK